MSKGRLSRYLEPDEDTNDISMQPRALKRAACTVHIVAGARSIATQGLRLYKTGIRPHFAKRIKLSFGVRLSFQLWGALPLLSVSIGESVNSVRGEDKNLSCCGLAT